MDLTLAQFDRLATGMVWTSAKPPTLMVSIMDKVAVYAAISASVQHNKCPYKWGAKTQPAAQSFHLFADVMCPASHGTFRALA
ncbi:hypothetical protein [Ralstonia mannitolilytica]|uniref:hypothetical protein n=1 Tax=Ralstonia mannitolilytica TaxID=105219 RepID=UPI0012FDFDF8|nr:hypothetical protein [Ralstonia mannitolilytica]QIF06323.1 hypothetical protein G5A69_00430 [Ralstonia mannitolilytica]